MLGTISDTKYENQNKKVFDFYLKYAKVQKWVQLQSDVTYLFRERSSSLKDRQDVKKSKTVVKGNYLRPLYKDNPNKEDLSKI